MQRGSSSQPRSRWSSPAARQRRTSSGASIRTRARASSRSNLPDKAAAIAAAARSRRVRRRLQRALPAQERERLRHRDRLRHRGRARGARRRPATTLGTTIEGPDTWARAARRPRQADVKAEKQADAAALGASRGHPGAIQDEIVVLRVDYFENYAGRFLSVEAKDRLGGSTPTGATYIGPTLSLSWNTRSRDADRLDSAGDERQHRPGHDAGHLHRAPRARAHRRRRHDLAGRADADPDRLEHRRVGRGAGQRLAGRRPAADEVDAS